MGGSGRAVLVPWFGSICAFREPLFVDTVSSEGFLVSAWSRTQGTPPRTLLQIPIATLSELAHMCRYGRVPTPVSLWASQLMRSMNRPGHRGLEALDSEFVDDRTTQEGAEE